MPTMPLSVCSRTHIQLGAIPLIFRSARKRTASILVIFMGPTPSAAARACPDIKKAPAPAAFRKCLRLVNFRCMLLLPFLADYFITRLGKLRVARMVNAKRDVSGDNCFTWRQGGTGLQPV